MFLFILTLLPVASTNALLPITSPNGTAVMLRGCTADQVAVEQARGSDWCKITVIDYDTREGTDCSDPEKPIVRDTACKQLSSGKYKRYECLQVEGEETYRYYYNTYSNGKQCEEAGRPGSVFKHESMGGDKTIVIPDAPPKCAATSSSTGANIDCSRAFPAPACKFDVATLGTGGLAGTCSSTINAGDSCVPKCRTGFHIDDEDAGKFVCGFGEPKGGKYEGKFSSTTQCSKNICTCENGEKADLCTVHKQNQCKEGKCNDFFHHEEIEPGTGIFACIANTCKCNNGVPIDSAQCLTHDMTNCKNCTESYELKARRCEKKIDAPDESLQDGSSEKSGSGTIAPGALSLVLSVVAIIVTVWGMY